MPVNKIILIFLIFLLIIVSTSCYKNQGNPDEAAVPGTDINGLDIATSIVPVGEFIKKIGGDKVNVTVMVPPGVDPHTYEPAPRQLESLSGSHAYVMLGSGLGFELAWMDKIMSVNSDIYIIDCSEGIELLKSEHAEDGMGENNETGPDPHIWLSPNNVKVISKNIYEGLKKIDSINEKYYSQNLAYFLLELDSLDEKIRESLVNKNNKKFIVYHPAWSYFAKDYGLEQIPVEKEGKEPTARALKNLINTARENNIKVIFASPQFNPKSAEVIASGIGGTVVFIDPLGADYVKNMEAILESFKKYLQ